MEKFLEWLKANEACQPGYAWTKKQSSVIEFWQNCPRGNWLVWLLYKCGYDRNAFTLLVCDIVRNTPVGDGRIAWDLLTDERSRNAIVVTEKYVKGEATIEELWEARRAAFYAADDAFYAADAASYAANAAFYAAAYAAWATGTAFYAAADATYAADTVFYAVAASSNEQAAQQWQADYIRSKVSWEEVENLINEKLNQKD